MIRAYLLSSETTPMIIWPTGFSDQTTVKEIFPIELDSRFFGQQKDRSEEWFRYSSL